MSRYHSYLNSSVSIIDRYDGTEPFASYLKKYFAEHKKFGSRDRKQVGHICYCFFRMGKMMMDLPLEERIMTALFLCSTGSNEMLQAIKPEWDEVAGHSFAEKLLLIDPLQSISGIFPWKDELGDQIEHEKFCSSFLIQPDLFIRLRPGKENIARQKLQTAGVTFRPISENCIALPNTSKIDNIIELDKEAVVQDLNSQRVGELMQLVVPGQPGRARRRIKNNETSSETPDPIRVWDCCAASGGKSILAKDVFGEIELFVSDLRESILVNLENRFERAGLDNYERFIADLSKPLGIFLPSFNLVIADVPCSGSGTWSRTPEQLYYFDPEKIGKYAMLQKEIIQTAVAQVEPGGHLLYITCSVFKKENEEQIEFIKEKFHLQLVKMESFKGYDQKADTLFAALLSRPK